MRMSLRRLLPLFVLFGLMALCAAAPAFAQEDGVTVDPDSPSGKEYAVPLEDARNRAGTKGKGQRRRGESPLFGAGVGEERDGNGREATREGSDGGGSGSDDKSTSDGKGNDDEGTSGRPLARSPDTERRISRSGVAPAGTSPLTYVGGALVLILAGAGVGYVLRRRSA